MRTHLLLILTTRQLFLSRDEAGSDDAGSLASTARRGILSGSVRADINQRKAPIGLLLWSIDGARPVA